MRMRCEQIQPSLLDYSKGLLTAPESDDVRTHIADCAECAALLEEEVAFSMRLATQPEVQPTSDVWALVRAKTRPSRVRPLAWITGISMTNARKAVAGAVAAVVLGVTIYSVQPTDTKPVVKPSHNTTVAVNWSDDPLGNQTDATLDAIENM